jgi:hypothetical protein
MKTGYRVIYNGSRSFYYDNRAGYRGCNEGVEPLHLESSHPALPGGRVLAKQAFLTLFTVRCLESLKQCEEQYKAAGEKCRS